MPKKRALITGILGQDGAYLARNLLDNGYEVYGADRRSADETYWRLRGIGALDDMNILHMDLLDHTNVYNIIETARDIDPQNESYNLALRWLRTEFDKSSYRKRSNRFYNDKTMIVENSQILKEFSLEPRFCAVA